MKHIGIFLSRDTGSIANAKKLVRDMINTALPLESWPKVMIKGP